MENIPEKGLIIKPKWLDMILDGMKTWEMRSTKTNIRGRIGLIGSGTGTILGEAVLYDCGSPLLTIKDIDSTFSFHRISSRASISIWKYPWILHDVMRLEKPIPYRHPQGAVIWVNNLPNLLY